jgi:serine protease
MRGLLRPTLVLGLGLTLAAPTYAQLVLTDPKKDPELRCYADQAKRVAKLCKTVLSCQSKYWKAPVKDPGGVKAALCEAKGVAKFGVSWDKSIQKAIKSGSACMFDDPFATVAATVTTPADAIEAGVVARADPNDPLDLKLRSTLLKQAGAMCSKALGAESKDGRKRDDVKLATARQKAHDKLETGATKAIDKALLKGVVYAGTAPAVIADDVDALVDGFPVVARPLRFIISGEVVAAESSYADKDVNDRDAKYKTNDNVNAAQEIPVPSTVGGYVNLPSTGPDGRSTNKGDATDIYKAHLTAGQSITLMNGDSPAAVDLDLCIGVEDVFNPGTLDYVDCSMGVGTFESIMVPSTGVYFIEVYPWEFCDCGSTYVLTLGNPQVGAHETMRLSEDFIEGEAIVKLRPSGLGALQATVRAEDTAAAVQMQTLAGAPDREMLFGLDPARHGTPSLAKRTSGGRRVHDEETVADRRRARLSADQRERAETIDAIKRLKRRPEVQSAALNRVMFPTTVTPTDPLFPQQWHYPLINLPEAWDLTTGGAGVTVAVIDTGVALDHPDFIGQLVGGYDFVSNPAFSNDGTGIDSNPDDPGDLAFFLRSSFHGTHVAGTVAASTFNGRGGAGVAFGVKIMPVRVLSIGGGTDYDVMQGVRYAAGLPNDSGLIVPSVDIINLSLGGSGFSQPSQDLFTQVATVQRVLTVAAAGNGSSSLPFYPAAYDDVVSVAALDAAKLPAPYTNSGPTIDLSAPGGDSSVDLTGDGIGDGVLSTLTDDSITPRAHVYDIYQGTSMAAPHVAGVAALMKTVAPGMTPADFDALLIGGVLTEDLGDVGPDETYGWGMIDAYKAVTAAINLAGGVVPPPIPILAATPMPLNFGSSRTVMPLTVLNGTGGTLTVTDISANKGWVTVTPVSVDADGLGSYDVSINKSGRDDGPHEATITFTSTANDVEVDLFMVKGSQFKPNAGLQYILLLDPDTGATVGRIERKGSGGAYGFDFPSVPAGEYNLVSGSDADNDGLICDAGESCGGFPTKSLLERIDLQADRVGIQFGVAFPSALDATATGYGKQ